jgi:hypothetical protein
MEVSLVDAARIASVVALMAVAAAQAASQESVPAPTAALHVPGNLADRAHRREACRDKGVPEAVRAAIGWLQAHQDEDGHWDCAHFMKHDGKQPTDGPGLEVNDVGVTGLALLVMLAEADPRDRESLERGIDWLAKRQESRGQIGDGQAFIYSHAIATLALIEGTTLLGRERWRAPAERAIGYLLFHRSRGAAWRYEPGVKDSDTSITSWCMSALCTAWRAGMAVPPEALAEPMQWLDSVTMPDGASGYQLAGEGSSRLVTMLKRFPNVKSEAMTAAAMLCRLQYGADPGQPMQVGATEHMLAHAPAWEQDGSIDIYYWYQGSQAMSQMGKEVRDRWFRALDKALLPNQRKDGSFAGSWDAVDPWGTEGGRVATTALATLALQGRYRMGDLNPLSQLPQAPAFAALRSEWGSGRIGSALQRMDALEKTELGAEEREALARLRMYLDLEVLSTEKCLTRLREAEKPDWLRLVQLLERTRDRFHGVPFGDKAAQDLAELMKREAVRHEVDAGHRLQALREKPPRDKKILIQELHKLVEQHPGTRAAGEATEWLRTLERR